MSITLFKSERSKRYRIHRNVRNEGVTIDAHKRTVYVTSEDQVTPLVELLRDRYGYSIQFEIV